MEDGNQDKTIIFIKDNLELKEGYNLINHHFIDVLKYYELKDTMKEDILIKNIMLKNNDIYQHADKIYLCVNLNRYGSMFVGNSIRKNPIICLLKEIDPILFLIKIVYLSSNYHNHKLLKESRSIDLIEVFNSYKAIYDELIETFFKITDLNCSKNSNIDLKNMKNESVKGNQNGNVTNVNRNAVYSFLNYLSKLKNIENLLEKIAEIEVDGKININFRFWWIQINFSKIFKRKNVTIFT